MYFLYKNIGLTETFWIRDEDGVIQGRLLEDWSISDDGLKWTLNLREGIPWHSQKGRDFGEWNAQDLEWNIIEGAREGSVVPPAPTNNALFTHEDGGYAIVDDYTVRVNTGVVRTDFQAGLIMPGTSQGMYSKQVFDQLGEDEGEETGVGTGPFEFVSFSTDEKLVLGAVEDHWRQTPAFAELVTWHMPDETTRLANFLTGGLDTYDRMNISNKPRLEGEPGVRFLVFPNLLSRIFLYGQYYPISGREPRPGWVRHLEDPTVMPYVATDTDLESAEWARARALRHAMNYAIDRQSLSDNLFPGDSRPGSHYGFEGGGLTSSVLHDPTVAAKLPAPEFGMNHTEPIDLSLLVWPYDPDRARQLMAEGGYPNGFETSICLCAGSASAPQNVMAEAVASMWEEIGIQTDLERLPYSAIGGDQFARNTVHRHLPSGGGGTTFEPNRSWQLSYIYDGGWNGGFEHPFMDEAVNLVPSILDYDLRWEKQRQIAEFIFEEVVIIPLLLSNDIFPVGPKIEVWQILGANLNSFELVVPRQE